MKKLIVALACIAALGASAINAEALSVGDAYYIGSADPGSPASASDEIFYINNLRLLSIGATDSETVAPHTWEFSRVGSTLDCSVCGLATITGASSGQSPSTSIDVTGWTYLLGKFGNTSYVWYVGGLSGSQTLPLDLPGIQGSGQSHYSLYNPVSVPEGGSTLMLLGMGLAGVAALRRRFGV